MSFLTLTANYRIKYYTGQMKHPLSKRARHRPWSYILSSHDKELQNRIFSQMNINSVFAKSIRAYLSHNFSQLKDDNSLQKILVKDEEISEFAKGVCLEEGFDDKIKCLNKQSQERVFDVCKHVHQKHSYNKNKFLHTDYPVIGFPKNMYYSYTYVEGREGNIVDDDMIEYLYDIG